jgi:hypothetical protein
MSTPTTFQLFPQLLPEIRLLIWEHALQPRIIPFTCTLSPFNPRRAPQALHLVGGDPPFTHFSIDVPQRPTSPYYLAQCSPGNISSPALLRTCHESRAFALSHGYRVWKIENGSLGSKDLLWNPDLDIILLRRVENRGLLNDTTLHVFVNIFQSQLGEIKRLVVETDGRWAREDRSDVTAWERVSCFRNLEEVVLLIGENAINDTIWEWEDWVSGCLAGERDWILRIDDLESEERMAMERYKIPKIRVVANEGQVLDGSGYVF